jgi:hypothetical protein
MPTYAEWVATGALMVASASLGWQVVEARRRRPQVEIEGTAVVEYEYPNGKQQVARHVFFVWLWNFGEAAVTVADVGFELRSRERSKSLHARGRPTFSRTTPNASDTLPLRLEPRSSGEWHFALPPDEMLWPVMARPVATVVARRPLFERIIKRSLFPEREIRGRIRKFSVDES